MCFVQKSCRNLLFLSTRCSTVSANKSEAVPEDRVVSTQTLQTGSDYSTWKTPWRGFQPALQSKEQQVQSEVSLVLMLRLVRLWQDTISSSSISVSTLACLRYGIRMHGRTPNEIRWRLSLISSHSSSSPISFRSRPSGTHSPAILSVLCVSVCVSDSEMVACCPRCRDTCHTLIPGREQQAD